jgi:hypothetical protein
MKTIFIRYHHHLVQMVITLVLIVIVRTISSAIFADIYYYKALFIDYLKNSRNRRDKRSIPNNANN